MVILTLMPVELEVVTDDVFIDQTRLGAWIMDGDPYHRGLLRFALTEQSYSQTVVLLVASMSTPWNILETLQRWVDLLSTHVDRPKISRHTRRDQEDRGKCVPEQCDPTGNLMMT